jgi:four helix bundle protein
MTQTEGTKRYDLEERTERFARQVMGFIRGLQPGLVNHEVARQLVRSAGSVGANYIEANSALGKKDFLMRIRICRKEAKESAYWLRLLDAGSDESAAARNLLVQEANELVSIFGAIITKTERKAAKPQSPSSAL